MIVPVLYTTLALTPMQMQITTKNSNKLRALQRVQLTSLITASDQGMFLFPVFGFCYLEDICIIKETKELGRQKR